MKTNPLYRPIEKGRDLKRAFCGCLFLAVGLSWTTIASCGESAADLLGTMYWTHRDEGIVVLPPKD